MQNQDLIIPNLSAEEPILLDSSVQRRRYAAGALIFQQGDPGTQLYVVVTGRVTIRLTSAQGGELVLAQLGPGTFFGEQALLDGQPRSADAVASVPTELLLLSRAAFLRLLEQQPQWACALLRVVSQRARQNAQAVQDLAFLDVPARLAKLLLQLAEREGQPGAEGTVIGARLTQTELAALVGATRESVNKWLGCYERRGLIRRQNGQITVLRPRDLYRRSTC